MESAESSAWELSLEDGVLFHDRKGRPKEYAEPPFPLIDTHGHLTAFWGMEPVHALVRAAAAGICRLVVPLDPADDARDAEGVLGDLEGWCRQADALIAELEDSWHFPVFAGEGQDAKRLPSEVRIVCGAHPYGARRYLEDPDTKQALARLLASPRCAGIGEIGLDYTSEVPKEAQKEAFADQLQLACRLGLPAELHIRDAKGDGEACAHKDALEILQAAGVPSAGCDLHCYTGTAEVLAPYLDLGCSVAFGGALTFRKSDDIRRACISAPAERLLLETDCPYMAPVPLRGLEGEPAMAGVTAAFLAALRLEAGVASTLEESYRALWENGSSLFYR